MIWNWKIETQAGHPEIFLDAHLISSCIPKQCVSVCYFVLLRDLYFNSVTWSWVGFKKGKRWHRCDGRCLLHSQCRVIIWKCDHHSPQSICDVRFCREISASCSAALQGINTPRKLNNPCFGTTKQMVENVMLICCRKKLGDFYTISKKRYFISNFLCLLKAFYICALCISVLCFETLLHRPTSDPVVALMFC